MIQMMNPNVSNKDVPRKKLASLILEFLTIVQVITINKIENDKLQEFNANSENTHSDA